MPSIVPANRISIRTRSGAKAFAVSIASSPSEAMATERYPALSILPAKSAATTASSSTMSMFALGIKHRLCVRWTDTRVMNLEVQFKRRSLSGLSEHFPAQLLAQHANEAQAQRLGRLQVEAGGKPPSVVPEQQMHGLVADTG